jgi:outer membrane receptor protein involved in Fe transport
MKKLELLGATALALLIATPAFAQTAPPAEEAVDEGIGDIVVTAQRQSESLQSVPIAVSAFTGEALEAQQIDNASDLQLTLPNITFTKTNFTGSSFTIRGIGDLCVGFSCDSATGIHVNDMPLLGSRLFETEYFDLERLEVLRGPQGTLFGRNATSGVVNVITAKPDLTGFKAAGEFEYGNFNSIKAKGMVNVALGDTLGVRVAGFYLNRDGYSTNVLTGKDFDGRDLYSLRGTIRWQPSSDTTLDLIGYYFHEKDNRSRIQKQLCHRDPTGILGCQPDRLGNDAVNANATFPALASSREFFRLAGGAALGGLLSNYGLQSVYAPDIFSGTQQPESVRKVRQSYDPTYYAEEFHAMAKLNHDFGPISLNVTGGYASTKVDSRTDYYLNAANPFNTAPGSGLAIFRSGLGPIPAIGTTPVGRAFLDSAGNICVSEGDPGFSGNGGGFRNSCSPAAINYDRSVATGDQYSLEGHIDSNFDGRFNFLLGGIYFESATTGDYIVAGSGIDYAAAVLGYAQSLNPALGAAPGSLYVGAPFFNNRTDKFTLKSYGIFGEGYFDISDTLKLTGGLRYSNDKKYVRALTVILNFPVPVGTTDIFASPYAGVFDADPSTPGAQKFREQRVGFGELTGRIVLDWKPSNNNLVYASLSRGYKSGGINPPFNPAVFPNATVDFKPEFVNAVEFGTKNTLANGKLRLNASAFFYQYKDLQLSQIINRTSFNANTDADIYGVELEAIIKPDPAWLFTLSASYLNTKIKDFSQADTRDPSGGRSDTVIIRDVAGQFSNCVVIPTVAGNAVGANTLVAAVNGSLGLAPPVPVPGTNTTGAFSACAGLAGAVANPSAGLRALFATPTGALPFTVTDGVPISLAGNSLPQAPNYKFSAGAQHTTDFSNGMNLVLRGDLAYTGEYFARSFNRPIDKIKGYAIINLSAQLNAQDDRWFVRGFVQNLTGNNAITGEYLTDASTGLFTNIFTLEPRRYGISAGFKF